MFIPQPTNDEELRRHVEEFVSIKRDIDTPRERIKKIEEYLRHWNINQVVVGISGGVDSALVLAMLDRIKGIKVHAVTIGFDDYKDVFKNEYIYDLQAKFYGKNIVWHKHDLSLASGVMFKCMDMKPGRNTSANVTYAMRYLAFFAYAQEAGGITFGTTNRDEMGYAGWFGKNSDMMVDIQPISDLHKHEVIRWARELGVPEWICARTPTGDLINGTSDEENFGCTYNELSYFTAMKSRTKMPLNSFMEKRFEKLIALHERNAHKYQGQKFNPVFITG